MTSLEKYKKLVHYFFQGNTSRNFINHLLCLIRLLLTANIICISHYFRWISWPFLRARIQHSFEFHCVLSGLDVSVWLNKQNGFLCFSFFTICIFIFFLALSYMYVLFLIPPRVLSDLEEGYEKSVLTRTKPFLLQRTLGIYNFFLKRMWFYLPFNAITTWN